MEKELHAFGYLEKYSWYMHEHYAYTRSTLRKESLLVEAMI